MIEILNIKQQKKKNGEIMLKVQGTQNGEFAEFLAVQQDAISMVMEAGKGGTVDMTTSPTNDEGVYFLNVPKGKGSAPRPNAPAQPAQSKPAQGKAPYDPKQADEERVRTMLCAYAKDVVVATITSTKKEYTNEVMEATFLHWFGLFQFAVQSGAKPMVAEFAKKYKVQEILETFPGSTVVDNPGDENDVPDMDPF